MGTLFKIIHRHLAIERDLSDRLKVFMGVSPSIITDKIPTGGDVDAGDEGEGALSTGFKFDKNENRIGTCSGI